MAVIAGLVGLPSVAAAAELPAHDPLQILVVSDEVNPNGLSDPELTQPGDLSAAIGNPGSGISLDGPVREVGSQCIDDALAALGEPGNVDVLVYFAHLDAFGCDGSPRQAELTTKVEEFLREGGGVVVFHHGIYSAESKGPMLELLGGVASSIAWDTVSGQDVVAVAPDHFIATQSVEYGGSRAFSGIGVPAGEYPFFNNTPDERYDDISPITLPGEARTLLFASDDGAGGGARVLGYDLHRPDWMGHVVFYQPGEYQPQALDDLQGNNFQILANAIYWVATTKETGGGGDETGGMADTGSADESGGGNADAGGDDDSSGGTSAAATSGSATSGASTEPGDGTGGLAVSETTATCSVAAGGPAGSGFGLLGLLALGVGSRRRSAPVRRRAR